MSNPGINCYRQTDGTSLSLSFVNLALAVEADRVSDLLVLTVRQSSVRQQRRRLCSRQAIISHAGPHKLGA